MKFCKKKHHDAQVDFHLYAVARLLIWCGMFKIPIENVN